MRLARDSKRVRSGLLACIVRAGFGGAAAFSACVLAVMLAGHTLRGTGQIAFESKRDGISQIYSLDIDHGLLFDLSHSHMESSEPSWSPDGSSIAYHAFRFPDGTHRIYLMNPDGSNQRAIYEGSAYQQFGNLSWSPDSRQLAYISYAFGTHLDVFVMGADGSNPRNLTRDMAHSGYPAWSPDGKFIAMSAIIGGNMDIFLIDAASTGSSGSAGQFQRVTDDPASDIKPSWSPDGRQIAFVSDRDGNFEIYTMHPDGSGVRRLTYNNALDSSPAWSPDGQHIAFVSDRSDNLDLYVMDADGSRVRRLTTQRAPDQSPVWWP
jgi:TolB protein